MKKMSLEHAVEAFAGFMVLLSVVLPILCTRPLSG